jgi:hypothetical protein
VFSGVGYAIFHAMLNNLGLLPGLLVAILFWTIFSATHHYFCWLELRTMVATGNFEDYRNSGLSNEDIAMGLIQPAEVSKLLAILFLFAFWIYGNAVNPQRDFGVPMAIFYAVLAFLIIRRMVGDPYLLLPDAASYFRTHSPLALIMIGWSMFIPVAIFCTILMAALYGLIHAGLRDATLIIAAYLIAIFLSRFPNRWINKYRVRRFYARYDNFSHLFDEFVEKAR